MFSLAFIIFAVTMPGAQNRITKKAMRIAFGRNVPGHRYPYVIALQEAQRSRRGIRGYQDVCSGSLVTNKFVLTAAHCLSPDLVRARFGGVNLRTFARRYSPLVQQIPHPDFKYSIIPGYRLLKTDYTVKNDIALVTIKKSDLHQYALISAIDYKALLGYAVSYVGFGSTSQDIAEQQRYVKFVNKNEYSVEMPQQMGDGLVIPSPDKIDQNPEIHVTPRCGGPNYTVILGGDSGGPLFRNGKIVGVAHSGDDYMTQSFTAVSPYLDWISSVVNDGTRL